MAMEAEHQTPSVAEELCDKVEEMKVDTRQDLVAELVLQCPPNEHPQVIHGKPYDNDI